MYTSGPLAFTAPARQDRVNKLIGSVDQSLSLAASLDAYSALLSSEHDTEEGNEQLIEEEGQPLPSFMIASAAAAAAAAANAAAASSTTAATGDDVAAVRLNHHTVNDNDNGSNKKQDRRRHHSSDSGIGSSVTESLDGSDDEQDERDSTYNLASMVNQLPGSGDAKHTLSARACRQIQKHIILPILKQHRLKQFHPLVTGIPVRVSRKEVTCLRDLEKVLLYLAPRFAESRRSFVDFCETSIQCLHTTVEHLSEADQRRPSDRPYSNAYFVDLTEQVRRYATLISAARQRIAAGDAKDGDQETTTSKLSLEGGIGRTGRPAQLVRTNEHGRSVSLATGAEIDLDELRREAGMSASGKSRAADEDEEDILLSMARRRKTAAERASHRCAECDKEFKRPCDLTKHEKTHSRPWKCTEAGCKYAEYGWPTEKERDRHVNDKHSATPAMYKCQYHPCPYESKRESNCKQHMEKAHGWAYVRSKHNGKSSRATPPKSKAAPSHLAPASPATSLSSSTPDSHAVSDAAMSDFGGDSLASPFMTVAPSSTQGSVIDTSPHLSPADTFSPSPYEPNLTAAQLAPPPSSSALTPQSMLSAGDSSFAAASTSLMYNNNGSSGSSNGGDSTLPSASLSGSLPDLDMPLFNDTFDWSNMDTSYTSMNMQLFTPATSIESYPSSSAQQVVTPTNTVDGAAAQGKMLMQPSHFSPNSVDTNGNSSTAPDSLMLYTPGDLGAVDDGFADFLQQSSLGSGTGAKAMADFALFDDATAAAGGSSSGTTGDMGWFGGGMPGFQSRTWAPGAM